MGAEIVRLIGVYNGDGGIRGQVAHAFGKFRGTTSCALCDITYRGVRKNPEWSDVACATGVPFDLVHLNERSAEVATFTANESPCVVAETTEGLTMLLRANDFTGLSGDAGAFLVALRSAVDASGLPWPGAEVAVHDPR
jgi:hypothetical protein